MKKKVAFAAGFSTIALLSLVGAWALLASQGQVSLEKYGRIRMGSTLGEVESIFGGPGRPGLDKISEKKSPPRTVKDTQQDGAWDDNEEDDDKAKVLVWSGEEGAVFVRFAEGDRVVAKMMATWVPLGFIDRIRFRLGW